MDEAARNYVSFAKRLASNGCFNKSLDIYLTAFEKYPSLKNYAEADFRLVLNNCNELLANSGKVEEIFSNYSRAVIAFPDNCYLINDMGKYLYKYGFLTEAYGHFQKSLSLDFGFVDAEKNLNSIKNLLVERWHFRMLNDTTRNNSYRSAIHEVLKNRKKKNVLDIGTGTGLLAMYASECNALSVTACDGSDLMSEIAKDLFKCHSYNVHVLNKMSTEIDEKMIMGKKSLITTELFDAGLFGEHVLDTLAHAWSNLISNEGTVIPGKAEFYIAGVKCNSLNMKYQLCSKIKNILKISNFNVHISNLDETYDCEDIHFYKDLKFITNPELLLSVDFTNYSDIVDKINNEEPYAVELLAIKSNEINSIVGWFNLYLTDNIMITTDPRCDKRANAWQQAIFFDFIPKTIKKNDKLQLSFTLNSSRITLKIESTIITRVSAHTIRFLNDENYVQLISNCIGTACIYLGQIADMSQTSVVDLSPFPLFGLFMLKRGAQCLVCYAKTESDKTFIEEIMKANNISLDNITVLIGENCSKNFFADEKYHAIFYNIFDISGDVDQNFRALASYLKENNLTTGGLLMPNQIKLMGQLVKSGWLDVNNRVYDCNVQYKISSHMNKYQVSQNYCLNLCNLEYTALSEPIEIGELDSLFSDIRNVEIINDGECSAVICWYTIEIMKDMGEISTKRNNSFIDGMAFLSNPPWVLHKADVSNLLICVDIDGSFKLMIDNSD